MSASNKAVLQRAYELIEDGQPEKAQEILAPLLEEDADNPALWWVYSHAAQDSAMGFAALERVLALDPQYPGARELLTDARKWQDQDPDIVALEASDEPAAETDIDDWEDLQPINEGQQPEATARSRFALPLTLLLVIVIVGALVLASGVDLSSLLARLLPSPAPQVVVVQGETATPALQDSVDEPTVTDETTLTATLAQETPSPEATALPSETATPAPPPTATRFIAPQATPLEANGEADRFVRAVADEVGESIVDPAESGLRDSSYGLTLVIHVCAVPGPEFSARLSQVMLAAADEIESLPEDIGAVAAGMLNCDDERSERRIIAAPLSAILEFAADEIDQKQFQGAWQPLS